MQKVLIVGPNFFGYNQSVERAFIKLGFQTKVLSFLDNDVEGLVEKVQHEITKNKKDFFDSKRKKFGDRFLEIYNSYSPDILFIIKGSIFFPEALAQANKSINVLWMMDSIFRNNYSYNIKKYFHHIFLFEETDVEKLMKEESITSHFLPLALDESVYYPIENKKDIDVLFVGAMYPNRKKILDKLVEVFPTKNIKVYGQFFSAFRKPIKHFFRKDKHIYINKNLKPKELNVLYSKTKVCLNIHHQQSIVGVNQRFFEVIGAKALEITDHKPFMSEHFNSNEVVWYQSEEEMINKIMDAIENYDNYLSVIEAGYSKVTTQHTFTARIEKVLSIINAN